jgi:hypothetical protein
MFVKINIFPTVISKGSEGDNNIIIIMTNSKSKLVNCNKKFKDQIASF